MTDKMITEIRIRSIKFPDAASQLSRDVQLLLEEVAALKAEATHWETYAHRLEERARTAEMRVDAAARRIA